MKIWGFFPLCNMTLRKSPNFEDVRMSDHLGLCIDLNTENLRDCGDWKLNNSYLADKFFVKN